MAKTAKKVRNGDKIDKKLVMSDLTKVLKKHGITAKIETLSFSSTLGNSCTCPDGRPGRLFVVGKQFKCICDG